jgi:acetoacetyl-CoA synthetase
MPKCIVHGVGGVLLNNKKEGKLHRDMGPSSTVLQYTTTGWIMYLVSCSSMIHGSRAVLYDGSPFQPEPKALLRLLETQRVTDFGSSPRYMQTLATAHPPIYPREVADLSALRRVTSTGMVLSEPQFHQFYSQAFPAHVQLSNISGGTDTASCLVMDTPLKPIYPGGCQSAALGMDIQAYSADVLEGEPGKPMPLGEAGELVCTNAFPTMPVRFWNDDAEAGAKLRIGPKYFGAYFARFQKPSVWAHGGTMAPCYCSFLTQSANITTRFHLHRPRNKASPPPRARRRRAEPFGRAVRKRRSVQCARRSLPGRDPGQRVRRAEET